MSLILLLAWLSGCDRLVAFYLIEALICLGLALAALLIDHPVLICLLYAG